METKDLKQNILIVDDDETCIFITEKYLQNDFNLIAAKSGYEALDALNEKHVDVILMDINLGDINMDGINTMRRIKFDKRHRDVKVIAITAVSNNRSWYLNEGFDGFFMKPIIKYEMIQIIKNLSGQSCTNDFFPVV